MATGLWLTITAVSFRETFVFRRFPIRLGRDAAMECPLVSPMASRYHARIELDGERLVLYDERSKNGTFVRGGRQRVDGRVVLAEVGDEFRIGRLTFHTALFEDEVGRKATYEAAPHPAQAVIDSTRVSASASRVNRARRGRP